MFGKILGFNSGTWIFDMKNRFGWRDKTETEHSGVLAINEPVLSREEAMVMWRDLRSDENGNW